MRGKTFTVVSSAGGTTYSPVYVPDFHANGFYVSMAVTNDVGTYTIQHTLSDPFASNLNVSTNGTWLNHEFVVSETTAAIDANYAFPVKGIRLALAAAASATATITILQGAGYGG